MKKQASAIIILGVVFFFSLSFLKAQEEPKYANDSFARMSFINGNVYIQRGPDLGFEEGIINAPIEEGDRLGTTDGRAEIYLGNDTYLRMDNNTKVDFLNLPKKGSDLIRLRVFSGNVYLSVNRLEKEKSIEIHTADASCYVLDKGLYRIDVSEDKKTEIYVFRGVMEAAGEAGSQLLKSEQTLEVSEGRFDSRPQRFMAVAEDNFDRWSDSRESVLRVEVAQKYLPEELSDFEGELSANGEWINIEPYGWVWRPANVDENWRPYYNGSWVSLSLGLTWVPYEPWGWAPFHYGCWGWGPAWGWYWIPGSMWGPAWVDWWWGYDYYCWAPLSWWGYPIVIVDGGFYGGYYGPYYPYNSKALVTVHKDQLKAKNISKVALGQESVKGLDKIRLTSEAPGLRPAANKFSVGEMQGNKVFLKKDSGEMPAGTAERNLRPTSMKGPEKIVPAISGEKGTERAQAPQERKIRRTDTAQRLGGFESKDAVRRGSFGYPASPNISIKRYFPEGSRPSSISIRDQFYRHFQGSRTSSGSYSSGKSISRGHVTSSGASGHVSSGSHGHSSGSHPSSSGSHPSSGSGGVKKKN